MQKTRVAIVGLGLPGLYHARGVIQSGEGILEAVCELNDERRKEFASRFAKTFGLELPQVRAVRDVDQVVADPRIDADRVEPRRLRVATLPHHRTCRLRHPAVEPGNGQFAVASCQGMMKP
jgi:uncharacterized protein (DUF1697 family)